MAKLDFDEIKRATDLVAVVQARGVALRREGKDWIGLCPFHEDRQPSLRVTPGKGLFRCMSAACGATGNVIQFVAKHDNVSEHEAAVRLLAALPGVQRGSRLEKEKLSSPAVVVPPNVAADLLARVAGFYRRTLYKADRAGLDYLASRQLADPAMLESFQVGYCNGTLRSALPKSGEVIAQLQALGVLNPKGNEVFYGRVTVPILDANGVVVGLYGRAVEGPGAKLPADSARHIYLAGGHRAACNAATAKHAARVVFVESIFDALSVWQAGERAVVPLYGADGWTAHHDELVRTTEAKEFVLALDNDGAGRDGTAKWRTHLARLLAGRTPPVRVLAWPEGVKDANAFFSSRQNAVAEFATLLAAAEPRPAATSAAGPKTAGEEKIEAREHGFALVWPARRYEVVAVERQGETRLKATVKALGAEPGRFHVETIDLYSARTRRLFAAEVARLFRLPPEIAEADLGKVLVAAEQHATAGKPAAAVVSEPDRAEAWQLGKSADLVGAIRRDLKKLGLIGEEKNGLAMYIAMTSRKLDDPLAVELLSPSGAGKSYLQDAVLSLCPDEDLLKVTSLSDRALFYKGEDSLRHKCLALEEVAGAGGARYALRNLISAKKLTVETTIKNPLTGKMETQVNTVYGPTAVFETTTQPDTDPETKSRFLVLSVDESPEQTRAIMAAQRHGHTLEAWQAKREREAIRRRHHAFQRLLKPLPVFNPYEPLLRYGEDARLTFRRDQPKYLTLILALAFLHQFQRPAKHLAGLGDYIEVTLNDIAIANDLALELFGSSLDDLSAPGRRLAEGVAGHVERLAAAKGQSWERVDVGRRELREALGWSETRLRAHLDELVRFEYLAPLGGRQGAVYRYQLLVSPDDIRRGGRMAPGLKSVAQVQQEAERAGLGANFAAANPDFAGRKANFASENPHFAGQNGHFAAASPGANGEVENRVFSSENAAAGSDFAAFDGEYIRPIDGSAA